MLFSEGHVFSNTDRLAVIYSALNEIWVWISGHDENRTATPHQTHGVLVT